MYLYALNVLIQLLYRHSLAAYCEHHTATQAEMHANVLNHDLDFACTDNHGLGSYIGPCRFVIDSGFSVLI